MVGNFPPKNFENTPFPSPELLKRITSAVWKGEPWSVGLVQLHQLYGLPKNCGLVEAGCFLQICAFGRTFLQSSVSASKLPAQLEQIDLSVVKLDEHSLLYVCPYAGYWVPNGETHREYIGKKNTDGLQFDLVLVSGRNSKEKELGEEYLNRIEWHFSPQRELRPNV